MTENEIATQIVDAAYKIHTKLGPGLLIVENKVIIELKSLETIQPVHKKQLITYLTLANKRLGLLINFGQVLIKNGITRIANKL